MGVSHIAGVASGTDAIEIALRALGVGPGDEVIAPANTCVPTIAGITASGAQPVLADIDLETYAIDPASIRRALTARTKAIVPVHLYGHPCDVDAIQHVIAGRDVVIMEDCAQAHGATYKGRPCGTLGAAAAFSFYPSKNLGALGDAGAVVTRDEAALGRVRELRNYGQRDRYTSVSEGVNSRLDEIQAAVLRVLLAHLDESNATRREQAHRYASALADTPLTLPVEAPFTRHAYHLYVVRTPDRDVFRAHLERQGVQTQVHYPLPVHLQPAYARLGYAKGTFPKAERACNEVVSLPLNPGLTQSDQSRIIDAVHGFFEG